MALVGQEIKNLIGGISQQPDNLRFSEQGETQINGFSSETDGLQKRPPTVLIKKMITPEATGTNSIIGDAQAPLMHMINRDATEQYYVMFTGSNNANTKPIRVFDLQGNEKVVNGDMSYCVTAKPRDDIRCITVADYTFITNKKVAVQVGAGVTNTFDSSHRAMIICRGGQYSRTLGIGINGVGIPAYKLPNGSNATDIDFMDAQSIINELTTRLRTTFPGWTFNTGPGFIDIYSPANQPITNIFTYDGYNDQLISAIHTQVSSVSKLPLQASNGFTIKISGVSNNTSDDYYVMYDSSKQVWKECPAPGVRAGLSDSSMPHVLVREANGSFTFKTFTWGVRKAGDLDTNPDPSFVGNTINDIFFFSNRLGFLSGENVILSRSARYGEFYVSSVSVISDDDPIDVATSDNRINILKFAVPFSEQLLLWSNDSQFVMSKNGTLTTKTINLDLTTNFSVSDYSRPFGLGRGVYFCSPRSTFSSINRFYAVQDVTAVNNADDITAHVPNYIPNGVYSIRGSSTENFVTVLTEGAKNVIYVYKYLYIQEQIRQQSWSHWEFPSDYHVLACDCINSKMYLVYHSTNGVFMETIDFTQNTNDLSDEPYRLYIDGKVSYTIPAGQYDINYNRTAINVFGIFGLTKYPEYPSGLNILIVLSDGFVYSFPEPDNGWNSTNVILELTGNLEGQKIFIGRSMPFLYTFSKLLIKQTADDGTTSTEGSGRLQLKRTYLNYKNTGAMDIIVDSGNNVFTYNQAGAKIGTDDLRLGNLNIQTGQVRFPTVGNAQNISISIYSDYPTPLSIVGCGWEGQYVRRTSGI
ncbi:TPA: hypothetical protein ACXDFY_004976 [Enterobacter roggenkampii]